jgi:hypothetical protein
MSLAQNATCGNRFAHLSPEECYYLSLLDCDHPERGLDREPAEWGPEWDAHRWELTCPDEAPELPPGCDFEPADLEDWRPDPADEAAAARLFCDADGWYDQDVFLEDDERPRQTWTPSRIAAFEFEYQERR